MPSLCELPAYQLRSMLQNCEISAEELIHSIFERIECFDGKLKGYITLLKENALKDAKKIDTKHKRSQPQGLLCGLPIAIKDNICTRNIRTSCGSKMLDNYIPPYNATVVNRIQEADGIIIGKTNMDEFAMGTSTETSYYGVSHNPWNFDYVAGGSSGGSAVAVAADEAALALGSDTGGSIRCPASFCGITGIKVTYGLISRYGLVSYACSLEQIGPLTKDIRDCALLLNLLVGHDPSDSTTLMVDKKDYLKNLDKDIKGLRIGVPKEFFGEGTEEAVSKNVWNAIHLLESYGATHHEISIPLINYAVPCYYIIAMSEASSNLARYDGIRYGNRVEKDEGEWNEIFAENRMGFGPEVRRRIMLGTYALSTGYYDMYYLKALKVRTLLRKEFESHFKSHNVIIGPTMPSLPFKIGEKISDPLALYRADIDTVAANITGLPALSIPCGFSNGLPIGLQIIGNSLQEELLLQIGYQFQQFSEFHKKKPFLT
ncbi:MAG TPA: Asp-tRNA(Asn)/Glu-tRNA(Gln) amidotransferase subunit GatA [Candidatus Deferrimicrobium sp.]|nr:Asp-tRNA(Asn)/Glu-tRNA(Gln) amidotransferase subunit GatA [Candidatus Deferrimicrobium sp.]